MKSTLLNKICCPKISKKYPCHGRLTIIRARYFNNNPDEIREGFLRCGTCGQTYPVLVGIPILLDDIGTFFRHNYHFI